MVTLINEVHVEKTAVTDIVVDYGVPLSELAEEVTYELDGASINGEYAEDILGQLPPDTRSGKWKFRLLFQNFGSRVMTTQEILQWGRERQLEPADVRTLLTFDAREVERDERFNQDVHAYEAQIVLPQLFTLDVDTLPYSLWVGYMGSDCLDPQLWRSEEPETGVRKSASDTWTWYVFIDPAMSQLSMD